VVPRPGTNYNSRESHPLVHQVISLCCEIFPYNLAKVHRPRCFGNEAAVMFKTAIINMPMGYASTVDKVIAGENVGIEEI